MMQRQSRVLWIPRPRKTASLPLSRRAREAPREAEGMQSGAVVLSANVLLALGSATAINVHAAAHVAAARHAAAIRAARVAESVAASAHIVPHDGEPAIPVIPSKWLAAVQQTTIGTGQFAGLGKEQLIASDRDHQQLATQV